MGYLILLLGSFVLASCRAQYDCNIIGDKSPVIKLKRHLFCEYDVSVRPVFNKETATNVTISLSPKFMDFIDQSSTFVLHSWIFINWKDEHLTWKPEDFSGVEKIRVRSDDLWVPDFSVYNSGDMDSTQTGVPQTTCQLLHTGAIMCVPSLKYSTQCETDYTYWPYDSQTCSIRMGSWSHTGEEINFDFRRKSIIMVNFTPHKEWSVTNYTTRKYNPKFNCCPNDTFPTLIVDFELRRHSQLVHAVYITPAVVLMVITCTVLWLDSRSVERISLAAVNFICHILCIYDLHWIVPSNGSTVPHILLYYRDSLVLATFAMIITTLLRKLQATKVSAPRWIISTVSFVASNRAGRFILLDDADSKEFVENSERDVEENSPSSNSINDASKIRGDDSWRKFAIIIEWLSFIAVIFTYLLLIFTLLPIFDYGS